MAASTNILETPGWHPQQQLVACAHEGDCSSRHPARGWGSRWMQMAMPQKAKAEPRKMGYRNTASVVARRQRHRRAKKMTDWSRGIRHACSCQQDDDEKRRKQRLKKKKKRKHTLPLSFALRCPLGSKPEWPAQPKRKHTHLASPHTKQKHTADHNTHSHTHTHTHTHTSA